MPDIPFYQLPKTERDTLVLEIYNSIITDIEGKTYKNIRTWFSDSDTYIRKSAYLCIGKIYLKEKQYSEIILNLLNLLIQDIDEHVRQSVVNATGEIGKSDFEMVAHYFDSSLFDKHLKVRNAVIGSVKKMGEVNPEPVLNWAQKYLHHPDKEIRREICHGIELRGRKHPEDILDMLQQLENDQTSRIKNTLIHVIGQISYKKGCLFTVLNHLKNWENKNLVSKAIDEIIDVHWRYRNFSFFTQEQCKHFISNFITENMTDVNIQTVLD